MGKLEKSVTYAIRARAYHTVIPKPVAKALGLDEKGLIKWSIQENGQVKIEKIND